MKQNAKNVIKHVKHVSMEIHLKIVKLAQYYKIDKNKIIDVFAFNIIMIQLIKHNVYLVIIVV